MNLFHINLLVEMPSVRRSRSARGRAPLADEIAATGPLRTKSKKRKLTTNTEEEDGFVDTKASRKILKISQDLIAEDASDLQTATSKAAFSFESRPGREDVALSDEEDEPEAWGDTDEELDEVVRELYIAATLLS